MRTSEPTPTSDPTAKDPGRTMATPAVGKPPPVGTAPGPPQATPRRRETAAGGHGAAAAQVVIEADVVGPEADVRLGDRHAAAEDAHDVAARSQVQRIAARVEDVRRPGEGGAGPRL